VDRGPWAPAWLWARADLRTRWKALVAVGLIAGLTSGLALASIAGARRTDTALGRLREQTNASDAIVFASQRGAYHPDWSVLAGRPEVRALAVWGLVFGNLDGDPEGLFFTPVDDSWMQEVDGPLILEGRTFDPRADDEVLVSKELAEADGIDVGDTIPFTPYTPEDEEGGGGPLQGPRLTMRVVGIMRTPIEELFLPEGFGVASPGLIDGHPEVSFFENAFVQLVDPATGATELEAHATADVAPGTPILDLHVLARRVTATTDVERSALLLLGVAIALAGLVLAGQVVTRSASLVGRDARILEAVGMRRRAVALAPLLSHAPAIVVAALACSFTAAVASRWLPFGLAGRLEPDPGAEIDPLVVGPGLVVLMAAMIAGIILSASVAARPPRPAAARDPRGPTDWARRHASVPVGIGASMAFGKGGRRDLPVRPALLGAVVGVLGVASAITLDAALNDALRHPERAGVVWDGQLIPGDPAALTEHGFVPELVADLQGVSGVTDLVQVDRTSVAVQSAAGVPAYSLRPVDEETSIALVTIEGRGPSRPGEVAVGPDTLRAFDLGIGDSIDVGDPPLSLTIVGEALFPTEVHAGFDEGVWLTPIDYDAVRSAEEEDTERAVGVRFDGGATDAELAGLQEVADRYQGFSGPAEVPPELSNLRDVRPLPRLLAAFLAALAVAALLHVLVTTTHVRAREFAVLRALGVTRRGTRVVVNVQGTAVFLIGLVLGAPLGVAAGRVGWRLIAERVPLDEASPWAVVAIAVLVPVSLVVAQVVALGPGRRVARLRTAEVLRTE
jgi:hypothetical protein